MRDGDRPDPADRSLKARIAAAPEMWAFCVLAPVAFVASCLSWEPADEAFLGGVGVAFAVLPAATFLVLYAAFDVAAHRQIERSVRKRLGDPANLSRKEFDDVVRDAAWRTSVTRPFWRLVVGRVRDFRARRPGSGG